MAGGVGVDGEEDDVTWWDLLGEEEGRSSATSSRHPQSRPQPPQQPQQQQRRAARLVARATAPRALRCSLGAANVAGLEGGMAGLLRRPESLYGDAACPPSFSSSSASAFVPMAAVRGGGVGGGGGGKMKKGQGSRSGVGGKPGSWSARRFADETKRVEDYLLQERSRSSGVGVSGLGRREGDRWSSSSLSSVVGRGGRGKGGGGEGKAGGAVVAKAAEERPRWRL